MGELSQSAELGLDRGQRVLVDSIAEATAERFQVPPIYFSAFRTEVNGVGVFSLVYTASSGIDLGGDASRPNDRMRSWKEIFGEGSEETFVVEVGGHRLDTRLGLTWAVYGAFIGEAGRRRHGDHGPLPDSDELASKMNGERTDTWLTGEKLIRREVETGDVATPVKVRENAWVGRVDASRAVRYEISSDRDFRGLLFRPAIRLDMLSGR